jgi:hypothetical protein
MAPAVTVDLPAPGAPAGERPAVKWERHSVTSATPEDPVMDKVSFRVYCEGNGLEKGTEKGYEKVGARGGGSACGAASLTLEPGDPDAGVA